MTTFVHSSNSPFRTFQVTSIKVSDPDSLNNISIKHPHLRVVNLTGLKIDSSGLAQLLPLWKQITSLNLSGTNVFDRPQMIGEFKYVTHLDVSFTTLSEEAVHAILGLPNLQFLKIVHTNIRREWLEGTQPPKEFHLSDNLLFV